MIYVMSDIHGMYDKYLKMMELIDLKEDDRLYVLGDVVDRGPDSMKILLDMMKRPNVLGIVGNHELMMMSCMDILLSEINDAFLDSLEDESIMKLYDWVYNGGNSTMQAFKRLSEAEQNDVIAYIMNFTAYDEVMGNGNHYLLVHAGIAHFDENKPLDEYELVDFVWTRPDWAVPYYQDPQQFVVVGHTPTWTMSGEAKIFYQNQFIAIDCGACFERGKLACLCLDTMEEYYV